MRKNNRILFILTVVATLTYASVSGADNFQETRGENSRRHRGGESSEFRLRDTEPEVSPDYFNLLHQAMQMILNPQQANSNYLEARNNVYGNADLEGSQTAIDRAIAFFERNRNGITCNGPMQGQRIANQDFIIVNDFTKPIDEPRQFLINMRTGEVTSTYVAHGYGSNTEDCPADMRYDCMDRHGHYRIGCKIPTRFTNDGGHGTTLRGFFVTGEQYVSDEASFRVGQPPYVPGDTNGVRLHGLQAGVNDTANETGKVWHRAPYGDRSGGMNRCAFSAGCPVVLPDVFETYKDLIDGGALMYNHTIEDEAMGAPEC